MSHLNNNGNKNHADISSLRSNIDHCDKCHNHTSLSYDSSSISAAKHFNVVNQNFGAGVISHRNSLLLQSPTNTDSCSTLSPVLSSRALSIQSADTTKSSIQPNSTDIQYDRYRRQLARLPRPVRGGAAVNPVLELRHSDIRKNIYTWSEIRRHNTVNDCWLVVRGVVYDVSEFLVHHPAGISSILRHAATEASQHYDFHSRQAHKLWNDYAIGVVDGYEADNNNCSVM